MSKKKEQKKRAKNKQENKMNTRAKKELIKECSYLSSPEDKSVGPQGDELRQPQRKSIRQPPPNPLAQAPLQLRAVDVHDLLREVERRHSADAIDGLYRHLDKKHTGG